jgi:hypothetical protein
VSATSPGVSEEQVVGFGSDQVPGICIRTACLKKVGVLTDISLFREIYIRERCEQWGRRSGNRLTGIGLSLSESENCTVLWVVLAA